MKKPNTKDLSEVNLLGWNPRGSRTLEPSRLVQFSRQLLVRQ